MASLADKIKAKAAVVQELVPASDPAPPVNNLTKKINFAEMHGEYMQYAEISRICTMPVWGEMTPEELEAFNRENVLAEAYREGFRFFPEQANAITTYEATGGLFGAIACGSGKTVVSLMIANKAYQRGIDKIMLLVPPQVMYQLTAIDIKWARCRMPFNCPVHILGGRDTKERAVLARSGRKGLYIMPYSLVSARDAYQLIYEIAPKLLIADEAHNLASTNAARTRRIRDYIEEARPQVCVMSGTITSKTINDYWHMIRWSLGQNNPLPNSVALANEWAAIIDASALGTGDAPVGVSFAGPLMPLVRWAQKHFPQQHFDESVSGFRKAFKIRLTTAPGVVSSGDASIGTSLMFQNAPVTDYKAAVGWEELDKLIKGVTEQWLTPNGDEIEHAIHCWKWLYELSSGFYNQLTWPSAAEYAQRKQISEPQAQEVLARALIHHAAGQGYARVLRRWLLDCSKPGIDTPMLVGKDMALHADKNVGEELYDAWRMWKAADFEGRPDRDKAAVRVCDFKIKAVVEWVKSLPANRDDGKHNGAILWYHHHEIGKWLHESLRDAGVENALYCPAGDNHNQAILDPLSRQRFVSASITAHGTGKNLQHHDKCYFVQWPRPANTAEQTIARVHRNGQKADELPVVTNSTLEFDQLNFAACLNDALYIHQTTGNRQKLIYGSYDPLPRIFPSAVLRERGFQNELLSVAQQKALTEKFGG